MGEMPVEDVRAAVQDVLWFHSIDLGHAIMTPGTPPNEVLERPGSFPDVEGRSVLDIGTWDGKYAFRAEQAGASRVVALDHLAWSIDFAERARYWQSCDAQGVLPDPDLDPDNKAFWHTESMPGRRGFDLAKQVLGSAVEPVVGDLMTIDLADLGVFDVVLYFGVLYHVTEPFTALRRLRQITGQVAAIETAAVRVPGHDDASLVAFYPGNELSADHSNWFAPTESALHGLCRAAGFRRVDTRVGPPAMAKARVGIRSRLAGRNLNPPPVEHYRLVVHAYP